MTMTVKLPPLLEQNLRRRSAALGVSASMILRKALEAYLSDLSSDIASAYSLGEDLFGKYSGPPDLAQRRKHEFARVVARKRKVRGGS